MKIKKFKSNTKAFLAIKFFAVMMLLSGFSFAATHNIVMTAEHVFNGQPAYKMVSHTSSDGSTHNYPVEATIPGPALFVKEGDVINIELTNNTQLNVGFLVPALAGLTGKELSPGQSGNFQFTATTVGTHAYGDAGSHLTGLFGAIIVDRQDGKVQSFIDGDGTLTPVNQSDLKKEFVMFMVGSTFWGTEIANGTQKPLWTNPTLGAVLNDVVRFHIVGIGHAHTFHLHAHRWPDETNFEALGVEPHIIDAKLLVEPFDTHSFTVKSGTGVGTGFWQYHCHLVSHMESGMAGKFHVVDPNSGATGESIAGASPNGNIWPNLAGGEPGLATFEISDEPGSWFRSIRSPFIKDATITSSLEIVPPGSSVHFIMSDTNAVHTITSLLWPSDANDPIHGDHRQIPMDQTKAYRGGGIVKLDTPGLYVFTCKVHPYMFGAVIVDDPNTKGLDLGTKIDIVTGINNLPTISDLATRLLRTFFVATVQENWQDYTSSSPWHAKYPNVDIAIGDLDGNLVEGLPLKDVLEARYGQDVQLATLFNPETPGVGEVWINTQFEKTAGKTKPGTITVLDATTWEIKRKIALPQINMNHPHNMWSNRDQSIIFQTQWFDNKLTFIDRATGNMLHNIRIGDSPSHVMTIPQSDLITVAINGENSVAGILPGQTEPFTMMHTQQPGQVPANPHGHWISPEGVIVTPNINTADTGFYDGNTGQIIARPAAGANFPHGPHPIAIGMGVDKVYTTNLLDHSMSVYDLNGNPITSINLIADYDPINPTGPDTVKDRDGDGLATVGVLPIQTPVDPTGRVVVTANTGGSITIVDTSIDKVVAMLPCDPGCHGVNFGAKSGGGYYAYVSSKFSNQLIVVDPDPNGDGNFSDAAIVGRISLVAGGGVPNDDKVVSLAGTGGQGVLAVPNVYNGWVQNLPAEWREGLTPAQLNPVQ